MVQCLRLHKECKPGIPGCVLNKKVQFIADVAQPPSKRATREAANRSPRGKRPASKKKS